MHLFSICEKLEKKNFFFISTSIDINQPRRNDRHFVDAGRKKSARMGYFVEAGLFRRCWSKKNLRKQFQHRRNGKSAGSEKGEKCLSQDGKTIFITNSMIRKVDLKLIGGLYFFHPGH